MHQYDSKRRKDKFMVRIIVIVVVVFVGDADADADAAAGDENIVPAALYISFNVVYNGTVLLISGGIVVSWGDNEYSHCSQNQRKIIRYNEKIDMISEMSTAMVEKA